MTELERIIDSVFNSGIKGYLVFGMKKTLAKAIEQYVIKARIEELEKLRLPMNYDERPVVEYKDSDGFVQCDKSWSKRINERIEYYKAELKKGITEPS